MFCLSSYQLARFKPYSVAVETRFKWRHKENDRWRRLMDASCFLVDWFSQTHGPTLGQYSGHWSHILTCAHVICPWDYPNYYSPDGPAQYVSHITIADTMTQIRVMSMQGKPIEKHFCSNQHIYVHSNPQLDICVLHAEQNFQRFGEMRLLNWQNNGLVVYPRLEINTPLRVGDEVWIYGMQAHESLFDEEKLPEPLMIPTGIRGRVHTLSREHFFVTTIGVEREEFGEVHMGMCGSAVMRNGKCVGMLTAMVHLESDCKELAGTAMCTYATDIFEFLLEVEKQMKNATPPPPEESGVSETSFLERRRKEYKEQGVNKKEKIAEYKNWELDYTRLARHVGAPLALWEFKQEMFTGENVDEVNYFGRDGIYNQEVQENLWGFNLSESSSDNKWPTGLTSKHKIKEEYMKQETSKEERCDTSPRNVYTHTDNFGETRTKQETVLNELFMESENNSDVVKEQWGKLQKMRQSLETIRKERETAKMKESAFSQVSKEASTLNTTERESIKNKENVSDNRDKSQNIENDDIICGSSDNDKNNTYDETRFTDTESDIYTTQTDTNNEREHAIESTNSKYNKEDYGMSEEKRRRAENIRLKKQERKEQEAKNREQLQRSHEQDNFSFDDDPISKVMQKSEQETVESSIA